MTCHCPSCTLRRVILWIAFFAALQLLVIRAAMGQPPIPPEEFDRDTHLWLARAFVAEAGWEAQRDWDCIAWVIARRWKRARRHYPRFVDMLRQYAKPLSGPKAKNPRQRWLRSLAHDGAQPAFWPAHRVAWDDRVGFWNDALRRAAKWASGEVADPCRGRAWHYRGPNDPPTPFARVWCGRTLNRFYSGRKVSP